MARTGSVTEARGRMVEGGIDVAVVDAPLPDEYGGELVRKLHDARNWESRERPATRRSSPL